MTTPRDAPWWPNAFGPQRIVCLTDKQYALANTFSTPGRNLFTT